MREQVRDESTPFDEIAAAPSSFGLSGRHIVVTGAGRGLGQGIALSAALAGATVTMVARSEDQLSSTAALAQQHGGTCHAQPADLADIGGLESLVRAIRERGPIDGVVHAAGVQRRKDAVDVTREDWNYVQTMNVEAPYFLSTAIARTQLADECAGSHVFVGSLNSTIALRGISPYVAAKSAVAGIARAFSAEWAQYGIRANTIGPGYFLTKLTEDVLSRPADRERILGRIPMRKLGTPADLGAMAVFLLSDASRYVTGQLLNVDGGWLGA
jgi:2-deoxy-D-gluconate 3-dehydrogenase